LLIGAELMKKHEPEGLTGFKGISVCLMSYQGTPSDKMYHI